MAVETDRAIGRLEAQNEAIKEALERMQTESRESRSRIYAKIEETDKNVIEMKADLKKAANRLDDAEGRLTAIDKIREQVKGGAVVVSLIWAIIGGSIVVGWKWIIAKLGG